MSAVSGAFDGLAGAYDQEWSHSPAGRLQREAVWREITPLFHAGDRVLDLGCGTGEDAAWLMSRGILVTGVDPSAEMVRHARTKGVDAHVGDLVRVTGLFDGVLSNFAALNCVADPASLREPMSSLVRSGGPLALCMFGKFCAWETLWYAAQLDTERASRRWGTSSHSQSLNIEIYYPSIVQIANALAPDLVFLRAIGIGLFVPPSYVKGLPKAAVQLMSVLDRGVASLPGLRSLCDHQLLLFRRR